VSSKLPIVSGREAVRAFERAGFVQLPGRGKGSHMAVWRENPPALLTIPDHRELKRGLLRALIRKAGMSVDDFVDLL